MSAPQTQVVMHRRPLRRIRPLHAVLMIALAAVLVACDEDEEQQRATPTAAPFDATLFPVVLEPDIRVIAKADGSGSSEVSVEPPAYRPLVEGQEVVSPDGATGAVLRDGSVFFTTGGGEPREVGAYASTLRSPEYRWSTDSQVLLIRWNDGSNLGFSVGQGGWSPDGEWRLVSEESFPPDGGSFQRISVVRADGSEIRLIGELALPQGDGGWDGPTWSPDGSRIAGLSTLPEGGVCILNVAGASPLDLGMGSVTKFSWSPDGRQIAFDEFTKEAGQTVSVADLTTGDVKRLAEGYWPRWSPRGDRIAFRRSGSERDHGSSHMIYTVGPDGTGLTLVAEATYLSWFTELIWSPDGDQLSFVRPAVVPAHLYAIDLQTGEAKRSPTELAAVEAGFGGAELSPEGDRMAFARSDGWLVMDIATGELDRLYEYVGYGGDVYWGAEGPRLAIPNAGGGVIFVENDFSSSRSIQVPAMRSIAFSPDGKRLAITADQGLSLASLEGDDATWLFAGAPGVEQVDAVDWSPSGDALLYTTSRFDPAVSTSYQLFVSVLEGGQSNKLFESPGHPIYAAQWSPDGQSIALMASTGGAGEIVVIDADGGGKRSIARLDQCCAGALYWSPDGSRIALNNASQLDVIDVASGAMTMVATTGSSCNVTIVGWSQDGNTLYVFPACHAPQL